MIFENYWIYRELAETGRMTIHTCDINKDNWEQHEKACLLYTSPSPRD